MSRVSIDIPPRLERRLADEACRQGVSIRECALSAIELGLAQTASMPEGPQSLEALASAQGTPLAVNFEDLLGDFWPEDETADDFVAAVRQWRREGSDSTS